MLDLISGVSLNSVSQNEMFSPVRVHEEVAFSITLHHITSCRVVFDRIGCFSCQRVVVPCQASITLFCEVKNACLVGFGPRVVR